MRLSEHFYLNEFLASQTAERKGGKILEAQLSPPQKVIDSLQYLVDTTIQPLRSLLGVPIKISSGYRSPELNNAVGGSATSQHVVGEAADLIMSNRLIYDANATRVKKVIENKAMNYTGHGWRGSVNANYYLFAVTCLYLNDLDIDQVIHEYGEPGQPAWVHISASTTKNRREILQIDKDEKGKTRTSRITLEEALSLGC